jgi:VIT1/CCC1 family predicted Fe2+/Mn2+ transporter
MAAGEYVSVSSQRDAEAADVEREKKELKLEPDAELRELAGIYEKRGLTRELATEVAKQLSANATSSASTRRSWPARFRPPGSRR